MKILQPLNMSNGIQFLRLCSEPVCILSSSKIYSLLIGAAYTHKLSNTNQKVMISISQQLLLLTKCRGDSWVQKVWVC